jgi:predicted O-linked N-acetylglucosamine transferase (SPINDLY family)
VVASRTQKKKITASGTGSIVAMMTKAVAAHEKGDLKVAERGYRAALAASPDYADALQLLGVVRHQQGDNDTALELLRKAKALEPRNPNVRSNLGSVLNALERHAEAVEEFRAALTIEPRNGETWCNLGIALRADNHTADAVDAFERATAAAPKFPKAHHELAGLLLSVRDYPGCEAAYRGYLALVPDDAACISNLAYAVQCQGRLAEAEELFGRAIDLSAESPELRYNLRSVLKGQGRTEEARAAFRKLLKDKPGLWTAELGVAVGLLARGATDEAMDTIQDILNAFPDRAEIWNDVGTVMLTFDKVEKAAELFKRATEIDPKMAMAFNNLGGALVALFLPDHAIPALQQALRLEPTQIEAYLNLSRAYRHLSDLDRASMFARAALELPGYKPRHFVNIAQTARSSCDFDTLDRLGDIWKSCEDLTLKHLPAIFLDLLVFARTREDVLKFVALVRRWCELIEAEAAASSLPPRPERKRAPGEKLRIGFLSADLRTHSVARFLTPVLQHYDRSRFSFHCYTPIKSLGDPLQVLFQQNVDSFTFIDNKTDYEAAEIIRNDGIDILFELNGFTEATRLSLLAWKPAPVQISWLGYPFTCGLKAIDHVLIDRFANPADPAFMTEEPIVMPEAWVCFGEFTDIPVTPTLPLERNGYITFGTLNSPYKYNREVIAAWAKVMNGVPNSRFLCVRPEASSATLVSHIAHEFEKNGVSPDRLFFFNNKTERKNHLEYYNQIDVTLDTFPLTGGTTTCDATWMGVPVVSLVGESFHQRISYSVLMQCGLEELCTFTVDDFIARGIALANDVPRLRTMRQGLRDVLRASPLCDEPRFLHQFQEMLEQVAIHHGLR